MADGRVAIFLCLLAGCSESVAEFHGPGADRAFLRAEECFRANDYAQSVVLCEHALRLDPDHTLALALLDELERVAAEARRLRIDGGIAWLTVMDWRMEQALRLYARVELALAEAEVEGVLSTALQLPPGLDPGDRVERAQELMLWIRAAKD